MLTVLSKLTSCTGEIESSEIRETEAAESESSSIFFEGVKEVNAISNSKMEIYFLPAKGSDNAGKEKVYMVNVTEIPLPISLPESILVKDYRGYLKYTITGLEIGKSYTVGVDVREEGAEYIFKTKKKITKSTFDNYVSDFSGVSFLSNAAGPIGTDSINIRWASPKIFNSGSEADGNVDYLEVTVIDSSKLTPADMNNMDLGANEGRYTKSVLYDPSVVSTTFRGLPSNTKFYVQVRAIHVKSEFNVYQPELRSELNTNYLTITTLKQDFDGLGSFTPESFVVQSAVGKLALSSVSLFWESVDAVFDHYRIYFADDNVSLDIGSSSFPTGCSTSGIKLDGIEAFCKKIKYDLNSTNISGLRKITTYNFTIVLCLDFECHGANRILMATKSHKTEPSIASFSGVVSVNPSTSAEYLGKMLLNYEKISFNDGYFDGLVVEMSRNSVNPSSESTVISHDYIGDLIVREYDFFNDTQIVIDNIDYETLSLPYCFSIYPFLYDASGSRLNYPNDSWICSNANLANTTPTLEDFSGFETGFVDSGIVTLSWLPAQRGVYTHFEIFYRKTAGAFSISDAIQETTVDYNFENYERFLVPADDEASNYIKIISNLNTQVYQFGILTYIASSEGILRSELNNNVLSCDLSIGTGICE